ncbi:hypothetical protein EJ05DRAFT_507813 [Pseudovirgaria hyperparasitica]|uniref:Uncharacterized protein n=1 Tax=Pseudovirgaria hyperparasitica TaxID=470096 RepID=A0A6A6WJ58_9PEZI|nr:uncharacterized protein EJ05DRAFT_507813 [Pseudovirgaria hyperparasitica]KAF2762244.1 hypothetical protein EJ05DRAFT_507813 [Pseudovirgaria hyperparasitica]
MVSDYGICRALVRAAFYVEGHAWSKVRAVYEMANWKGVMTVSGAQPIRLELMYSHELVRSSGGPRSWQPPLWTTAPDRVEHLGGIAQLKRSLGGLSQRIAAPSPVRAVGLEMASRDICGTRETWLPQTGSTPMTGPYAGTRHNALLDTQLSTWSP